MRLKIYGISRIALVLFGAFPALAWGFFHSSYLSYRDAEAAWVAGFGILGSLIFSYFFRRGIFAVRHIILFSLIAVVTLEFVTSTLERNFGRLGLVLIVSALGAVISFWLERWMESAHLSPNAKWYEGAPKCIPACSARILSGEVWVNASVRTIDQRGFFVFTESTDLYHLKKRVPFELSYRGEVVSGEARVSACFFGEKVGFGLQFLPKDLYHFSQYTALVQRLRGEGL